MVRTLCSVPYNLEKFDTGAVTQPQRRSHSATWHSDFATCRISPDYTVYGVNVLSAHDVSGMASDPTSRPQTLHPCCIPAILLLAGRIYRLPPAPRGFGLRTRRERLLAWRGVSMPTTSGPSFRLLERLTGRWRTSEGDPEDQRA